MKLAMSGDTARALKPAGPSAAPVKRSGASVRRKLRAFLTKNTLIREDGTSGDTQKRH